MNVASSSRSTSGWVVVSRSANTAGPVDIVGSGHRVDSFARVTLTGLSKNHAMTFNHSATTRRYRRSGPTRTPLCWTQPCMGLLHERVTGSVRRPDVAGVVMMASYSMGVNRPRRGLSAAAVVGAFDPGDDRDAQFLAGGPAAAVEDVLLQQAKKDSMAALSPAAPTRPIEPTMSWRLSARTNFRLRNCDPRSVCRMQPATSPRRATALCSAVDGQPGLHPRVDGVADDPVGEHVLDRAEVELALAGAVLGDVGQPQLVRCVGGEVAARRGRRAPAGRPCRSCRACLPNTLHQPLSEQIRHAVRSAIGCTGVAGLVGQEPVAELRVVAVGVEQRVGPVRLDAARRR